MASSVAASSRRQVDAAAVALVGQRRGEVAVTDDRPPAGERRLDDRAHVMRAVGQHQQGLGDRRHRRRGVEHPAAKIDAEGRVAGFEGEVRVVQFGDAPGLRALAARVDPFEHDEETAVASVLRVRRRDQGGVGLRALGDRGALGRPGRLLRRGDFLVAFFAGFFDAFLVALVAFRGRVDGSALRRSASSSQARSSEIVSGVSPSRSVALVSPSVT